MNEQSSPNEKTPSVARKKMSWLAFILVLFLLLIIAGIVLSPQKFLGGIPATFGSRGPAARVKAAKAQIFTLGIALNTFQKENGFLPRGSNGLSYLMQQPPGATNWRGPYMERAIPKDPWGHDYIYECPGSHNPQGYDLSAIGPDGQVYGNWQQK